MNLVRVFSVADIRVAYLQVWIKTGELENSVWATPK